MQQSGYEHIIDQMTWSYSRIKTFDDCPYRWYLKYLRGEAGAEMFFSSYGSFMHELIESYYKAGRSSSSIVTEYLLHFREKVKGRAPSQKIFDNYFSDGLRYLQGIRPLPELRPLEVEKRVDFTVDGLPFVGYVDLLAEDKDGLVVVDNKSRTLKPRSTRGKITKTDRELDEYLRQLYIYAEAVRQEYGKLPQKLCFNCFRNGNFIIETFREEAFHEAKQWLKDNVNQIRTERDFRPDLDWFKCTHICDVHGVCEYYQILNGR